MNRFAALLALVLILGILPGGAQEAGRDTDDAAASYGNRADLPGNEKPNYNLPKFHPEYDFHPTGKGMPFYKYGSVQIAVPLIAVSGLLFYSDIHFHDLRNDYFGQRYNYYNDYMQYAPAVLTLGLKAFGVKGRSSLGRMLTSYGFAATGTALITNGIKLLELRARPDGSNNRSFPSGHAATAFSAATILHKEYGTTVSPWFSVGGYIVATGVGVSRVLNNKHWVSDIVAGAGIGILATELGYFIADKIFRDKGLLRPTSERRPVDNAGRPSFIGLSGCGRVLPFGGHNASPFAYSGISSGLQGAWFVTPAWGVGGQLSVSNCKYSGSFGRESDGPGVSISPLSLISAEAGAYVSRPVGRRWLLSGKLLAGVSVTHRNSRAGTGEGVVISYPRSTSFTATAGGAMTFVLNNHLGIKVFVDLGGIRYKALAEVTVNGTASHRTETNYSFPLSIGISFDALLW